MIVPRHDHHSITSHDAEADDHVQRVQPGHHEVQREEDLRVAEVLVLELESRPGHVVLDELRVVLDGLDAEERRTPSTIVSDQEHHQQPALAELRRVHRQRHRQAAGDEDGGVDRAEPRRRSSWLAAAKASGYQRAVDQCTSANRPPKNSTSVTRNTHMPSVAASFCCSRLSN